MHRHQAEQSIPSTVRHHAMSPNPTYHTQHHPPCFLVWPRLQHPQSLRPIYRRALIGHSRVDDLVQSHPRDRSEIPRSSSSYGVPSSYYLYLVVPRISWLDTYGKTTNILYNPVKPSSMTTLSCSTNYPGNETPSIYRVDTLGGLEHRPFGLGY
jgi:hypothetical protein